MNFNKNTLTQDVKREILAELQQGNYHRPPYDGYHQSPYSSYPSTLNNLGYSTNAHYSSSQGYSNPPYLSNLSYYNDISPHSLNHTYQIMKESVKDEILAEIQAQRTQQMAQMYGFDQILSDQKIQNMIEGRYRTLETMKAEIKKELQSIQRMENQRTADPYVRQVANSLVMEARQQGVPLEQVLQSLDQKSAPGTGIMGRMSSMLNSGQRKGFLYGIGAAVLFNLIWPSARNNLHSVAVRTMEGGMSIANRAKSFMGGHHETDMNMSFDDFEPEPHGVPHPPEVDILKQ